MIKNTTYACTAVLFFTLNCFAGDLPGKVSVARKIKTVDIYKMQSMGVKDVQIEESQVTGLLDLVLSVEGNICGFEPSTLAFHLKSNRDDYNKKTLALTVSEPYKPEPSVFKGCLAYSSDSQVSVGLELQAFVFEDSEEEKSEIVIPLSGSIPNVKIEVTFSKGGITAKIIN